MNSVKDFLRSKFTKEKNVSDKIKEHKWAALGGLALISLASAAAFLKLKPLAHLPLFHSKKVRNLFRLEMITYGLLALGKLWKMASKRITKTNLNRLPYKNILVDAKDKVLRKLNLMRSSRRKTVRKRAKTTVKR